MHTEYEFKYTIKRSQRRRTLCLQIRDGNVEIIIPAQAREQNIKDLLDRNILWIRRKLQEYAERPKPALKSYIDGETFIFLGEGYLLKVIEGPSWPAEMMGRKLVINVPAHLNNNGRLQHLKMRVGEWFRISALEEFKKRTEKFSLRLGVTPAAVKVKLYKRRWGSCTSQGQICYNWKLIIAPSPVVDYVVAHEVSHLVQHNHSVQFWDLVRTLMPDYQDHQAWLKKNGDALNI